MIYKSIVGSRAYGLSLKSSDTDILVVSTRELTYKPPIGTKRHIIPWTVDDFAVLKKGSCINWTIGSKLFPHEFLLDNDLSRWMQENREDMVKALLPSVYEAYISACTKFVCNRNDTNKWVMYAIHFRNMLADYAEGKTFAEALKPQGAERTFLLSVRNGIAPMDVVVEANRKARERAKAVAGFYAEPRADASVLDEFKHMVYREVELLKGGDNT